METYRRQTNLHTHTVRCGHALGDDRAYVEEAIKGGLTTLGFSDHTPYFFDGEYYSTFRMTMKELDGYVDSVLSLKKEYSNDINIKLGFETEYYPKYFRQLCEVYGSYPVDYIIMGQHFLNNETDGRYSGQLFSDSDSWMRYADQVIEGLETGCFTYLAHPDLLRYRGSDRPAQAGQRKLCRYAAKKHIPLEINLLGIRGRRHYPAEAFWRIAAECGCDAVIGSDAHTPEDVCDTVSLEKAVNMCRRLGLNIVDCPELVKPELK